MPHIISHIDDVPMVPPLVDRRRVPDRRAEWRGGRRDTDWQSRPPGALTSLLERRSPRAAGWRALVVLPVYLLLHRSS